MTYCVAVRNEHGLVFLSDSRTNAGVDQVGTFRKMHVFEVPGERVADFDIGRAIENQPHRAGLVVLDDQHDGPKEVRILEVPSGDQIAAAKVLHHDAAVRENRRSAR